MWEIGVEVGFPNVTVSFDLGWPGSLFDIRVVEDRRCGVKAELRPDNDTLI